MTEIKILTKLWDVVDARSIESYRKKGGYEAARKAFRDFRPEEIIQEIKKSGLQGRGGAGFLTGEKWEIAAAVRADERFFICNLDESEPGTFKDLMLAEKNPHQLLEGIIISCYAIGARKAYIYLNGKFKEAQYILGQALSQAYERNFLGRSIMGFAYDLEVELFTGAGAYICGEESALINSIDGKRGEPRLKPPFPCNCGLSGKPTVVNNAETISNIPWIVKNGAESYAKIGSPACPGTKLFCVDGSVKNPGIYEATMDLSVKDIIFQCAGGLASGSEFWFAQVGGSSGRIVTNTLWDEIPGYSKDATIPMGSGAILVLNTFHDAKQYLQSVINFFQRESCGKCVPCREGTFRMKEIVERLVSGEFNQADRSDMDKLIWTLDNTTFCPLGKFSVTALKDIIKYKLIPELS